MKLYESGYSRSARVRWLLQELELPFEGVDVKAILKTEEYRAIHPHQRMPAIEIDGKILFESLAICNYLADTHIEKQLISPSGTWERALHDQWTSFALTEMEGWLWSNTKHTFLYPEEKRVPQVLDINAREFLASAAVLEKALGESAYLVGNRFSVTDIFVSYTVNWGRLAGLLGDFPQLNRYLENLFERPHCHLPRKWPGR